MEVKKDCSSPVPSKRVTRGKGVLTQKTGSDSQQRAPLKKKKKMHIS